MGKKHLVLNLILLTAAGCDLTATSFAGTVIEMTLNGAPASPPGSHFELWARNQYNDTIRVGGIFDIPDGKGGVMRLFPDGFAVRPAITMDDPCMIDGQGNLLVTAAAYHDATLDGVFQSAEDQAQAVRTRIGQLTPSGSCDGSGLDPAYHCGHAGATLLGAVAYEVIDAAGQVTTAATSPPAVPFDADPATRLQACNEYWASTPLAYTPNPLQLTAPAHGSLYGELTFVTATPPSVFDAIRIDSQVNLAGIQELWITTEANDVVDPTNRGPVLLTGVPDRGGLRIVHFDLTPPVGAAIAASGTAAIEVDLDQDSYGF
jgi:hypothetical protein